MPFSVSEDAKKRREEADRMVYEETPEEQQYAKQLRQLKAPTPYESAYADQMDTLVRDYANRKPFTYDVNSDALYRQYRNQYITAGQQAMADTVGKASSMTGGYGNSYATTAGAQAYQAQLAQLNNMVPELYRLAQQSYEAEGQRMKDIYAMYGQQEALRYGQYRDLASDYRTDRSYLAGMYQDARQFGRSAFDADRNYAASRADNMYNQELQTYTTNLQEDQWNREFAENQRQYNLNMAWAREQYFGFPAGLPSLEAARDPYADYVADYVSGGSGSSGSGGSGGGGSTRRSSTQKKSTGGQKTVTETGTNPDSARPTDNMYKTTASTAAQSKLTASSMTQQEWAKHGGSSSGKTYSQYLQGQVGKLKQSGTISASDAAGLIIQIRGKYG